MSNQEYCELIEAVAARRDKQAFARLFEYYAPRFKAYAMRLGCGAAEAEELTQEAMIAVWRRADTFDRRKANASTWMFTVVRNKRIDLARRNKFASTDLDEVENRPADIVDADDAYDAGKAGEAIRAALKTLPPEQLLVLQKAFFEDKSHSAIAEELDLPLGTVKSRIRLALTRLQGRDLEAFV